MKDRFIYIAIFALLLTIALSGCSSKRKLQRAINKHGQKESIAYIFDKYPEYFKQDSIIIHDTIKYVVKESFVDTFFTFLSDTVIIENNRVITKLIKSDIGYSLSSTCKEDTVYIPIAVPCPPLTCPDITVTENKAFWYDIVVRWILTLLIFFLLLRRIVGKIEMR
jgi:uncharacterized protein YceK